MTKYTLRKVPRVTCPECEKHAWWLAPEDLAMVALPSFFICFECKFIGHVGVGRIPVTETDEEVKKEYESR